ncbi:hypothetical protein HYV72_01065 [Candidatus Uhrbacteria bacterium]|nr:hypothetical protein [Candidatus Uhrbacteria bacterium]
MSDAVTAYNTNPTYESSTVLIWKKSDGHDAIRMLEEMSVFLQGFGVIESPQHLEEAVKVWMQESGFLTGNVLWPVRVALSGKERSASPFEFVYSIGISESVRRLKQAIQALKHTS